MSEATHPARIRRLMLDNIFVVFRERDRERRMKAITKNYTEDVTWSDPAGTTQGPGAITSKARSCSTDCRTSSSLRPARSTSPAIWDCFRTTSDCRVSLRRSAASTLGWCEMDRSRSCTRC
jgi:hypothetical protein